MRRMLRGTRAAKKDTRSSAVRGSQVRQKGSFLERILEADLHKEGIEDFQREVRFHPRRKWLFDFAWATEKVAVEVEGGTMQGGRHVRGKGFENDCIKYNEACLRGWRVLRFTSRQVRQNECVPVIRAALGRERVRILGEFILKPKEESSTKEEGVFGDSLIAETLLVAQRYKNQQYAEEDKALDVRTARGGKRGRRQTLQEGQKEEDSG